MNIERLKGCCRHLLGLLATKKGLPSSNDVPRLMSSPLNDDVAERMRSYRQGDLLADLLEVFAVTPDGFATVPAPEGVVIVSQTCDVVQDRVPVIHVAPLTTLEGSKAAQARGGRWIRYIPVPNLGDDKFADVAHVCPVHKAVIASCTRQPGVETPTDTSKFGKSVGRNFSRFAFPDEVTAWMELLADSLRSKSGNLNSPEGRLLERVIQFRLQSLTGWDSPPYDLRLIVIVKPGTVPTFENDQIPSFSEELQHWLYTSEGLCQRLPGEVAEKIENTVDAAELYWLWAALGDAWAAKCKFKPAKSHFEGTVHGITSELLNADQFTLTMQVDSELMDLDDLSDSRSAD
jgi:hypothetical protein